MEFIKTGIPGLDEVLKGGFRKNSSVIVTGAPGTGKTIFALQFILEGAKNNEASIYISCEEDIEDIRKYAKSLKLDIEKYEKKGLITLIKQPIITKKLISIATPLELMKKRNVKRVVLDSLTLFQYTHLAGVMDFRKEVLSFLDSMKNVTLVATSECNVDSLDELKYKPEDFLFKGLIRLIKVRKGPTFERCLNVVKMRGQDHLLDVFPITIQGNGLVVYTKQLPFSLIEQNTTRGFKK